jgi:hypothetical protein
MRIKECPMRAMPVLLALALSMFLPAHVAAQSQITTAVIEGVVADTSGAVLPGVTVEIRNVDTNFTRTAVTDRDGRFVALQIPPGRYTVTFKLTASRRSCRRTSRSASASRRGSVRC